MKHTYMQQSDVDLVVSYQTKNDNQALETLLERHSNLLKKLANKHQLSHPNTIFEDCYQNAIIGAILAFKRFNPDFDVKLITFLHSTVYFYLLGTNDSESFVSCPSNLREIKSYFAGRFSEDKKKKFEQKHNLNNAHDIQDFEKKHLLLATNSVITTDEMPEIETSSENQIIDDVNVKLFIDTLPEEEREIVYLLMEGYSISKIARIFLESNRKISDKQIKKKLQTIQNYFV